MPNWCENVVTITAEDETTARAFFEATREGYAYQDVPNVICSHPREPATGGDADMAEWTGERRAVEGRMWKRGAEVEMSWASRWQPPIAFYEALHARGFAVRAAYLEISMGWCGTWHDGERRHVDYEGDRSLIPAEVEVEWSGLLDRMFEDADDAAPEA